MSGENVGPSIKSINSLYVRIRAEVDPKSYWTNNLEGQISVGLRYLRFDDKGSRGEW